MKKLIAFFKRAFTGPVNSMDDVKERKKDLKKLLIVSGVLTAICIGVGMIPKLGTVSMFAPIPGLFMLVVLFFFFILKRIQARFEFLHCDNCQTDVNIKSSEEFDTYVTYENLGITTNFPKPLIVDGNEPGLYKTIKVSGSISVDIRLDLTCTNCGNVKTKKFTLTPFKCEIERTNVRIRTAAELQALLDSMKNSVQEAINDCLDEDVDHGVPVTVTSIHHPNYENRSKPGCEGARMPYKDVTVTYFRYVDELIDGYFLRNELNF